MTKRQDLLEMMILETKAAKKYTESAMKKIEEKELGSAWRLADAAKCHAICAMQEHDLFWDLVGEDITSEEFDAFCEAEPASWHLENFKKHSGRQENDTVFTGTEKQKGTRPGFGRAPGL